MRSGNEYHRFGTLAYFAEWATGNGRVPGG
jgi:hypothetical protein